MTLATRRLAIFAAATATVAVTACSSALPPSSGAATPAVTTTTIAGYQTPTQTKGSTLRAELTALLVEHSYLLGRATAELAAAPAATPSTPSDAAAALDANSHDLADLVSAAYPADFGPKFSALWAARIAGVEAYAKAKAGGTDTAAATTALATNANDLATLFHNSNKYIEIHTVSSPGTGLRDELGPVNTAATALVDAQVAKDPAAVTKQVAAAELLPHTAEILAAAAAKLLPDTYPGTVTGSAANLRASLTTVFVEHTELAALAIEGTARGTANGPVAAALDGNARQIANVFAAVYGDQSAATFLDGWRTHLTALTDYATAKGSGDEAGATSARAKLDDYAGSLGAFLGQVTHQKLAADTATSQLRTQFGGLLAVADGAASHSPSETALVRTAEADTTAIPTSVAEAIAEQFPAQYLP